MFYVLDNNFRLVKFEVAYIQSVSDFNGKLINNMSFYILIILNNQIFF